MTISFEVVGTVLCLLVSWVVAFAAVLCMRKAKHAIEAGPAFTSMAYYWLWRASIWVVVWGVVVLAIVR